MNLKCIDSGKFSNLTKGNDYEGIEEGEFYIVANNMGARAKYAKKYFREMKPTAANAAAQRAAVREAAAPPPPPPEPDMMERLTITVRRNGNRINFSIGNVPNHANIGGELLMSGSAVSCGIYELSGINSIQGVINIAVEATPVTWRNRNVAEFTGRVMDRIMSVAREQQCLYILASDQIRADDVHAYLQQASETTATGLNPNSNNQIALYIIPRTVVTENAR